MTKNSSSFRWGWFERFTSLIKTDPLFILTFAAFVSSGISTFVLLRDGRWVNVFFRQQSLISVRACLWQWNFGVLFSILFLHYYERPASIKRKFVVAGLGSVTLIGFVKLLEFVSITLVNDPCWILLSLSFVLMCLLFTIRKPEDGSNRFDEFHPFRLLCRMLEAGLITGCLCLALAIVGVVIHFLPWTFPRILDKIIEDFTVLTLASLFMTFCPIYTLCRVVDEPASKSQPRAPSQSFFAFVVIPLIAIGAMVSLCTFVASFWKPVSPHLWLPFLCSCGAITFIWGLMPSALADNQTSMAKMFRIFRKVSPWGLIPLLLCSFYVLMVRFQTQFALSVLDSALLLEIIGALIVLGICAWKQNLSCQIVFLLMATTELVDLFTPDYWMTPRRAETVFVKTLQKYNTLSEQNGQVLLQPVNFQSALLPEEAKQFQLATMALIDQLKYSENMAHILDSLVLKAKSRKKPPFTENKTLTSKEADPSSSDPSDESQKPMSKEPQEKNIQLGDLSPTDLIELNIRVQALSLSLKTLTKEERNELNKKRRDLRDAKVRLCGQILEVLGLSMPSYHTEDWHLVPSTELWSFKLVCLTRPTHHLKELGF